MTSLKTLEAHHAQPAVKTRHVVDAAPDDGFHDLVKLAAQICRTSFARVTLMDEDRFWHQASVTSDDTPLSLNPDFYVHTFLRDEVLYVPDTICDARFAKSRIVSSSPHIRFYAGTAFHSSDGRTLGTLSVMDTRPHELSDAQLDALSALARQCVRLLLPHQHVERLTLLNECLKRERAERAEAERTLRESEERYRLLFEDANDCIYTTDLEGNYTSSNRAAARVCGYTRAAILRLNVSQVVVPEHLDLVRNMSGNKLAGRDYKTSYEVDILTKDGRRVTLDLSTQLIHRGGEVVGIQGIARDVTERRRVALALRESEERYRELFENANDVLYTHDLAGRFTSLNKAGERVIGYTREEAMRMNVVDVIAPEYVALARGMMTRKTDENTPTTYTLEVIAKGGRRVVLEVNTRLIGEGEMVEVQGTARDVTERERGAEALRKAEENYRNIFENAVEGIFQSTVEGRFISVNPAMARLFGYDSPDEMIAKLTDIGRQYYVASNERDRLVRALAEHGIVEKFESRAYRRDGSEIWVSENVRAVRDADGALLYYEGILEDITERKRAEAALHESEEQLRQSQKMEAVGCLAGGIAHDFNNLLTAINGYSDLLLRRLPETDPMRFKVSEIRKAGDRAASLTRQLLAFSRKQVLQPVVLDLNLLVSEMDRMLRRLIGEDIELRTALEPDLCPVKADYGQIEQVLMNLVVNARDAMPAGGKLMIETSVVKFCEQDAPQHALQSADGSPGDYVRIIVSDTGAGMDAETCERVFEPFFTTKEPGKGTGLGLSMAYGIIKQSGGHVRVESELGRGSSFEIFLPCIEKTSAQACEASEMREEAWPSGSETVLLVEDDPTVREMTREVLQLSGYEVLVAEDGASALELCQSHGSRINLILTDVIMPRMSGKQMADLIAELGYASTPVLFMSGYTADAIAHHGVLESGVNFLQKPFTPETLARKVRAALDAG